ncbi:hypothetical protein EV421DRAFT_2038335 [Armillaria borealis]|uniref:Nephrocystin 3-like N-terminal domain-containing protein n=1 Tax=Armillaria borealis TaxID=47425 RepID=A0AA39MKW5_9AGAR|nr:hypothetical protein EV421DRAFT_2038335 [Armillaria borealis]
MNSPVMAEQKQVFRYLQKVEIYDFQALSRNASHIYMKIIAGRTVHTSCTYEINPQSVIIWPMSPDWVDLGASTVVEFQVYRRSRVPLKPGRLLGHVKKPISDVAGNSSAHQPHQIYVHSKYSVLTIPNGPSPTVGKVFKAMEPIRSIPIMLGEAVSTIKHDNENIQSDSELLHQMEPARLTSGLIVEALASTQIVTTRTEGPAARTSNKIHYLRKVEVHGLVALPVKHRLYLEITIGITSHMTSACKIPSQTVLNWTYPINLGAYDGSIIVKFELFINPKTPLMRKESLGWAEQRNSAFPLSGDTTISLMKNDKLVSSLKVFLSDDISQVAAELMQDTPVPKASLDGIGKFLDAMDPIKDMIDMIADAHPAAKLAWSVVSMGMNLLREQIETDEIVRKLYVSMLSAFEQASRHEILQNRENLKPVYDALFQHTVECSIFIKGYVENKSWAGQISRGFLSGKAEEFCDGFQDLRDQLLSNVVAENLSVTLAVLEKVDEIDMHQLLQDLRPSMSLRPKSKCMEGTRTETINYLMDWIAECNGGGRNRLGAFIRYDHIAYRDTSHLITSIAYSLGMYDTRIGTTISTVLRRNRAVLSMAASSASDQFRILLQEPLESLQDLANEGPLVIIIDGIDEGDASEEMLAVLSRGFAVTRFALDTASEPVNKDIRFYIQAKFNDLPSDIDFEKACKELYAVDELTRRANGLFQWAATVCSFIKELPCISRLEALLSRDVPKDATDSLTTLYTTALNTIVSELPGRNEDLRKCMLAVLGAVIFAQTRPGMTHESLSIVLSPKDPKPQVILAKLGSVLQTTEERGGFIQLIHKSFADFLINPSRHEERWFIDVEGQKRKFARQCLLSLTDFLASWEPNFDIPMLYSKLRRDRTAMALSNQLSKWLQVTFIAGKLGDLLDEIRNVLIWVNRLATDMDCSLRRLTFHACQYAELELLPKLREEPPIGPSEAQVHWNNILPYAPYWVPGWTPRFSVSADSQILVATQSGGSDAIIMSWHINVSVQEKPTPKPISSFFNLEESLKNSQYDALGCLVTRSAVADYRSVIDSKSNSQAHWEVIGRYSDVALTSESTSAFISIHDVQTSCSHHYVFRGLTTYDLLLYATGIIIIDTQALVLMRIDVNATGRGVPRLWIRINEGDASQSGYTSLRSSDDSWQEPDHSSELEYHFYYHTSWKSHFVVSKDGLTLGHLQQQSYDDRRTFRCWSTTTGTILFTQEITSLRELSVNATTFSIMAPQSDKLFLHVVPSETDNIRGNMAPLQVDFAPRIFVPRLAVFSDEKKIAYVTTEDMFILDVQTKREIFHHPFQHGYGEMPSDIVVTPDGKTLITVHTWAIRTWRIDAL